MDSLDKLMKENLENIMDRSRKALLLEDETYIRDSRDKEALERRYNGLPLDEKERIVINDYIACIDTINNRIADVSYVAGASDAVKLLNSLGLLKKYE